MHDDAQRWLSILELGPDATETEIADAYRELVKVWHPDRFQSDPGLSKKAEAKLRDINIAYERLRGYKPRPRRAPAPPAQPAHAPDGRASDAPDRRMPHLWIFSSVSIVTAVLVGTLLYFGMPREAGTATDAVRTAPEPPRQPKPPQARQPVRQDAAPPEAPTTGTVTVFSQPTGATVFLDDRQVGGTPINLTQLTPGEHRIRLELDGYPAWSSPVLVEAGGAEKLLAILERKPAGRER